MPSFINSGRKAGRNFSSPPMMALLAYLFCTSNMRILRILSSEIGIVLFYPKDRISFLREGYSVFSMTTIPNPFGPIKEAK
ncbi:MAG: hypothetical protein ACD_35C00106G0001 [uncultured bacterium]|nr:MAG: hypothetical protein ACD_35C00106G0001 [uncultured bacterium]